MCKSELGVLFMGLDGVVYTENGGGKRKIKRTEIKKKKVYWNFVNKVKQLTKINDVTIHVNVRKTDANTQTFLFKDLLFFFWAYSKNKYSKFQIKFIVPALVFKEHI